MPRKKMPYGTNHRVVFTLEERDLIRGIKFADPDFGVCCTVKDGKIEMKMNLDEIEELQGFILAESNQTKNMKLQKKLAPIFDKLQCFIDEHNDQED